MTAAPVPPQTRAPVLLRPRPNEPPIGCCGLRGDLQSFACAIARGSLSVERESFPWLMSAPTTRVRSAGCAGRADGHAATLPPMSAMKSRGPHCLPSGRRIVAGEAGRSEAPCGKQATSANRSNAALGARSWLVRPLLPVSRTLKRTFRIDRFGPLSDICSASKSGYPFQRIGSKPR